jgi:sterol 3beta-glucosyltransferase
LHELGVGPAPQSRKSLTADDLVAAIERACTDSEMRQNAASLGERLRAEDGVGNTVKAIERHLAR